MTCAPSKNSDQPGRPPSFDQSLRCPHEETSSPYLPIERTVKTLIRLGGGQAQADLSIRWVPSSFFWFCHAVAHLHSVKSSMFFKLDESARSICHCLVNFIFIFYHCFCRNSSRFNAKIVDPDQTPHFVIRS